MKVFRIVLCSIPMLALAACSSDSDEGAFATSVDSNLTMSELNADDRQSLCESVANWQTPVASDLLTLGCTATALFTAGTGAACEAAVTQCKTDAVAAQPAPADALEACSAEATFAECDVTVAEINDCYDQGVALIEKYSAIVSCDSTNATELLANANSEMPAACKTITEKCESFDAVPLP